MASSSRLKPPTDYKQNARLPPPSLFLAPPSQAASTSSLLLQPTNSNSTQSGLPPLLRTRSTRDQHGASHQPDTLHPLEQFQSPTSQPPQSSEQPPPLFTRSSGQAAMERADALWAEMQNTLEDVELSAANSTHVFGAEHSQAIAELGQKQIALAQAWARGESNGEQELEKEKATLAADGSESRAERPQPSRTASSTKYNELELGTDDDIVLARRRREANDRYFHKVNSGVLDVVAKLEEVAAAMRSVEQASKELWEENDSVTESLAS